jgi:Translation initiation factor eIF3 subunit 135
MGRDGRVYVLDFARLFPPQSPAVTQESDKRAVFFKMLRPEFVRRCPEALSSDAFTGWGRTNREKYDPAVSRATQLLLDVVVPEFAEKCLRRPDIRERFQEKMHRQGINCRFLGRIRDHVRKRADDADSNNRDVKQLQGHLLNEMVARIIKNLIRAIMRKQMRERGALAEEPYKTVVLEFLNDVVLRGNEQVSDQFWCHDIKLHITSKYGVGLSPTEASTSFHLLNKKSVKVMALLERLQVRSRDDARCFLLLSGI